jgi:hypothetical protein
MARKKQQTFAKMKREALVRERRERKQEKKHAAAAERKAQPDESTPVALENAESALDGS